MSAVKILLVDQDPATKKMLDSVFVIRGYQVLRAMDPEEGLTLAMQHQPDVIVTDVIESGMSVWEMLRLLRSSTQFALSPLIFLTKQNSNKTMIEAFAAGADAYILKPSSPEELDIRIERAMQRITDMRLAIHPQVEAVSVPARETTGLRGSLAQVNLSAILTLLEMEQKSGILAVTQMGSDESARLFFKQGTLVSARFEMREEPKNEQLVYSMLGWNTGHFHFKALAIDAENEIRMSTSGLLLEGARLLDEMQRSKTESA